VVNWHGLNASADIQQRYSGTAIVEQRGYVAVYPNGLGNPNGQSFNAGNCCSEYGKPPHHADDLGFGRAIVRDVQRRICVDEKRIYSTGMSNGGFMSEYNACNAADLYAAVAPVSALGMPRADCHPSRPIPIIAFNGDQDPLIDYGISQQSMAAWAARNGCQGEPRREDFGASHCQRWSTCERGVQVMACTITGMAHCWPGNPATIPGYCASGGLADIDANQVMYDFFEHFRLP
jgi:polyhydroxybutyrate depolymerase